MKASRRDRRRGGIYRNEGMTTTYTVFEKGGKVWVEAHKFGGAEVHCPNFTDAAMATAWVDEQVKPRDMSGRVGF
jgi:hypothetical protein